MCWNTSRERLVWTRKLERQGLHRINGYVHAPYFKVRF